MEERRTSPSLTGPTIQQHWHSDASAKCCIGIPPYPLSLNEQVMIRTCLTGQRQNWHDGAPRSLPARQQIATRKHHASARLENWEHVTSLGSHAGAYVNEFWNGDMPESHGMMRSRSAASASPTMQERIEGRRHDRPRPRQDDSPLCRSGRNRVGAYALPLFEVHAPEDHRGNGTLPHRQGGLLRCSPHGAQATEPRPRRAPHATGIRQALFQACQELSGMSL